MSGNTTKTVQKETNMTTELGPIKGGQFRMQTWWLLGFLVVALVVLKTFIYIKDDKRDGK